MSWFSSVEDYSITDNGFYGGSEITYGNSDDDDSSSPCAPTASGAWDDYQHERENIISYVNDSYSR